MYENAKGSSMLYIPTSYFVCRVSLLNLVVLCFTATLLSGQAADLRSCAVSGESSRRQLVRQALIAFPWNADLASRLRRPRARVLVINSDVAVGSSGSPTAINPGATFVALRSSDLPRNARGADGRRMVAISQRLRSDLPGPDTLLAVVGVRDAYPSSSAQCLVEIEFYSGFGSSLGASLFFFAQEKGGFQLTKMDVSDLSR
jgi:hypothetical protein